MARYTMDVDPEFASQMDQLSSAFARNNKSILIQNAVSTYGYIKNAQKAGARIMLIDADGSQRELVLPS
jgi:predicted transcriptional regulator